MKYADAVSNIVKQETTESITKDRSDHGTQHVRNGGVIFSSDTKNADKVKSKLNRSRPISKLEWTQSKNKEVCSEFKSLFRSVPCRAVERKQW